MVTLLIRVACFAKQWRMHPMSKAVNLKQLVQWGKLYRAFPFKRLPCPKMKSKSGFRKTTQEYWNEKATTFRNYELKFFFLCKTVMLTAFWRRILKRRRAFDKRSRPNTWCRKFRRETSRPKINVIKLCSRYWRSRVLLSLAILHSLA